MKQRAAKESSKYRTELIDARAKASSSKRFECQYYAADTASAAASDSASDADDEVLFETFSLLQRPNVIEGDIFVSDEENQRVVVEALGANVQDGIAILVRKLKVVPPPKRDTMGNYIHSRMHEMTEDNGYQSLCEFISSNTNTSGAEGWTQLR
ncbi:hypothetical protein IW147_002917 [Coemansia sp. RSA 720]|nr:hypothetical protein IW147_002917 [Coemansia sp. RSA 720]